MSSGLDAIQLKNCRYQIQSPVITGIPTGIAAMKDNYLIAFSHERVPLQIIFSNYSLLRIKKIGVMVLPQGTTGYHGQTEVQTEQSPCSL